MTTRSDQSQRSFGDIAPPLAELTDRVLFNGVWPAASSAITRLSEVVTEARS